MELDRHKRVKREGFQSLCYQSIGKIASEEVVPRFRIFARDGKHVAFVQHTDKMADRIWMFDFMRQFMF